MPPERFGALCLLLRASPEEQTALADRRLLLPRAAGSAAVTLERSAAHLNLLTEQINRYDCPLGDLCLLTLEAQLWPLAARYPSARQVLARAFGIHASFLHWQGRFPEAARYGCRALDMSHPGGVSEFYWVHALIASNLTVSEQARKRDPDVVAEVLRGALGVANRPELEALLVDALLLESRYARAEAQMLAYGPWAIEAAERTGGSLPNQLRNARMHYAMALTRLGRYDQALEYTPEQLHHDPIQLRVQAGQWITLLLAMGERNAAAVWLERAYGTLTGGEDTTQLDEWARQL